MFVYMCMYVCMCVDCVCVCVCVCVRSEGNGYKVEKLRISTDLRRYTCVTQIHTFISIFHNQTHFS